MQNAVNTIARRPERPLWPVLVQNSGLQTATSVSSANYSFTTLPQVGNYLILCISGWTSAGFTMSSVTDNKSNTYSKVIESGTFGATSSSIYIAKVVSSSATFTITVTPTASSNLSFSVGEWSLFNTNAESVVDKTASSGATSSTGDASVGPTSSLAEFHELAIAVASIRRTVTSSMSITIPDGWAELSKNNDGNTVVGHHAIYRPTLNSNAITVNWSHNNTGQEGWTSAIATFRLPLRVD